MDKEHRKRAATREFYVGEDDETNYVIRVSGSEVELVRGQLCPWDNESGTGADESWDTWEMDTDTLKKLIQAAQWCIKASEEFEANHPTTWEEAKQEAADFNASSMASLDRLVKED